MNSQSRIERKVAYKINGLIVLIATIWAPIVVLLRYFPAQDDALRPITVLCALASIVCYMGLYSFVSRPEPRAVPSIRGWFDVNVLSEIPDILAGRWFDQAIPGVLLGCMVLLNLTPWLVWLRT